MEYVYAALVLHSAGQEVSEENITSVLEAADTEVDEARVKALTTALEGVDIEEAIESAAMPAAQPAETSSAGAAETTEESEEAEEQEESAEEEEEEAEEEGDEEAGAEGLGELF